MHSAPLYIGYQFIDRAGAHILRQQIEVQRQNVGGLGRREEIGIEHLRGDGAIINRFQVPTRDRVCALDHLLPFPSISEAAGVYYGAVIGANHYAGRRKQVQALIDEARKRLQGRRASLGEQAVSEDDAGGYKACLDLDKTGSTLIIRSRRPGDRFQPLGMDQTKKLNEFMIDSKITRSWRQRIPLVCSPEHILWVVGWRIDDRVKIEQETSRVLCLEFEKDEI